MKDISLQRIARWTLASFLVLIVIAFTFNVGIASAESGTINIYNSTLLTYSFGIGAGQTTTFNIINFDVANFNTISSFHITDTTLSFAHEFASTTFSITAGGSGTGMTWYDKNFSSVYYAFDSGSVISASPFTITLNSNIYTDITSGASAAAVCAISSSVPVLLKSNFAGNCAGGTYSSVQAVVDVIDTYNVTYPGNNFFNITIIKNSFVSSKYFIHSSAGIYSQETGFNKNNISGALFLYADGLYLNVTLSNGYYQDVLINSTNSGVIPPDVIIMDPITGVGIQFDKSNYALGGIANISWLRTIPTPFLATDYIVLTYPDSHEEELVSSPPDAGYTKVLMSPSGTYSVEFRRSTLFMVEVLDSDTATVGAEVPSYIYAPAQVAIGKLFNATYKIGWVVTSGSTAWIRTYHWDDVLSQWEPTYQSFSVTGSIGIETNTSIIVTKQGKYLIKLCDVLQGCKASTQTEAYFNGSEITTNLSFSNISLDKTSYSYGETMLVKTSVDNFNWSNKQIVVEYYDADEGLTQDQKYTQSQVESFPLYISDLTFSGSGTALMRLVGKNDSGIYILNSTAFTLSSTDTEGYGLAVLGSPNCTGDIGQIKVVVPPGETANLSISADNAKYNKDYVINGTRTVPYTFKETGTYYITLRKNGEAKRLIIIKITSCAPVVTTTPISGATQASQVASMLTSSIFWALMVTGGLMIFIAVKTFNGFASGIIGMLSAGVFTWMGWLPLAIFFSVLIIAALLLAGSVVAKQMSKTE